MYSLLLTAGLGYNFTISDRSDSKKPVYLNEIKVDLETNEWKHKIALNVNYTLLNNNIDQISTIKSISVTLNTKKW